MVCGKFMKEILPFAMFLVRRTVFRMPIITIRVSETAKRNHLSQNKKDLTLCSVRSFFRVVIHEKLVKRIGPCQLCRELGDFWT